MQDARHTTTVARLIAAYDAFLLDAYGVLVDKESALPGAARLLQRLDAAGRPWLVVTNSASRLPEQLAAEFAALGVAVPAQRIVTSGSLLVEYFAEAGLVGSRCVVLGPEHSRVYAERAGGRVVPLDPDADADALIGADQKDVRCLEDLNAAASLMLRHFDAGRPLALVLCNPDLIYPVRAGHFGFTAGGLAAMLESVLSERYPDGGPRFLRLGKPNRPIFDAARRRLGGERPLMIGDQLGTDILGAQRCGMDSALVRTGLGAGAADRGEIRPTWYLSSLED